MLNYPLFAAKKTGSDSEENEPLSKIPKGPSVSVFIGLFGVVRPPRI